MTIIHSQTGDCCRASRVPKVQESVLVRRQADRSGRHVLLRALRFAG